MFPAATGANDQAMNWDAAACATVPTAAAEVDYGSVGSWFGGIATLLVALVSVLVALGAFDALRNPRIRLTFQPTEPWCRYGSTKEGRRVLWVRIGVENVGRRPARGCVGRLNYVATSGEPRPDVDPLQLRWAGVPRSRAFRAMDLRRGQREYLNVLYLSTGSHWHLVTFEDPDFDPGFAVDLPLDQGHALHVSVYADNAATATLQLMVDASAEGDVTTLRKA